MNLKIFISGCTLFTAFSAKAQSTENDFNSLLAQKFGRQAFYSGALGTKDMKNHFAAGYNPEEYRVTNVVYVGFGAATQIVYPRILLTEGYEDIQQRSLFTQQQLISGTAWHTWSAWVMDSAGHNSSDFRYEAKDALYGFHKKTDKKYYLFWIPSYVGYEGAYNLDAAQCDILYTDVASAMSSDIEYHKKDIMDAVRKNVSAADWEKSERLTKGYLKSKPLPAHMKDAALERIMLVLMQPLWVQGIKSREVKLDMMDATVTRIWIVSDNWKIEKDASGRITDRALSTQALACTAGNCYLANVRFREAYKGGGKYSDELTVTPGEASVMAEHILQVPCETVKYGIQNSKY